VASKLGARTSGMTTAARKAPALKSLSGHFVVADPFTFLGEGRRCEGRNEQVHLTRPPRHRSWHPRKDSPI
jgi:hypothetical protein